jgi:hypothetical protein
MEEVRALGLRWVAVGSPQGSSSSSRSSVRRRRSRRRSWGSMQQKSRIWRGSRRWQLQQVVLVLQAPKGQPAVASGRKPAVAAAPGQEAASARSAGQQQTQKQARMQL